MRRWWLGLVCGVVVALTCVAAAFHLARHTFSPDFVATAEASYDQGEWSKAAQMARSALKRQPADQTALVLLARASAHEGNDEAAEAIYRRLGTGAMGPEDLFLLGRGLLRRNMTSLGLAAVGAALDLDANHPESLHAIIPYLIDKQELMQAAEYAERLMHQAGWKVRGMLLLAQARHELFDPESAATLLASALETETEIISSGTDPRDVRRQLATCLLETAHPVEARVQLAKVLASGSDPQASWLLSRSLLMEGKTAEARIALESSLERTGEHDPLRAEPAPFVGAARCAACHPKEFKSQRQSQHAATLKQRSELKDLPWPERPVIDLNNPLVTHRAHQSANTLEIETRIEDQTFAAVIEYAMGSNHQGRSFVGHDRRGQARELRLSQYPSAPVWSRTSKHPAEPPDPGGYLGRPISNEAVRKCVHCHSTNFRAIQQPEGRPEANDLGIGCERCHGPGGHHVRAVETRFPELAIARPKIATAERVVALCAECHKAPENLPSLSPGFIRFQAPTLIQSRCYTESGTLSCATCHNPHRNASRNPADYETVCLQCHPSPNSGSTPVKLQADRPKSWAPCRTGAETDCLSCHMPRIPEAVKRTVFTDHHIRIREDRRP